MVVAIKTTPGLGLAAFSNIGTLCTNFHSLAAGNASMNG